MSSQHTEVKPAPALDNFTWKDIASGISGGAWAVVLTGGLVFTLFRQYIFKYLDCQIETMKKIQDSVVHNDERIAKLVKTDESMVDALDQIATSQKHNIEHFQKEVDLVKQDSKQTLEEVTKIRHQVDQAKEAVDRLEADSREAKELLKGISRSLRPKRWF